MNEIERAAQRAVEARLRRLCRREHVVLLGRASAGIQAALTAWGAAGRLVLLPANTCYAVLWAVLRAGAIPYLVDVDPASGNVNAASLATAAGDAHPAAVIPCHLYGLPAPMREITAWAREQGALVLEDAALALGGEADGRPAGGWGDAAVISFGAGKTLDHGLGGALLTDDPALALAVRRLLARSPLWDDRLAAETQGWQDVYWALHQHDAAPALAALYPALYRAYGHLMSYRVAPVHWRGLAAALDRLPERLAARRAAAAAWDAVLGLTPGLPGDIWTPVRPAGISLWRYPLYVPAAGRDAALRALWAAGLHEVTRWYPSLQPLARALAPDAAQPPTPLADTLASQVLNLPL